MFKQTEITMIVRRKEKASYTQTMQKMALLITHKEKQGPNGLNHQHKGIT
jgi:hypothetical protein